MKTRKLTALVITLAMLALCACDAQPAEPTQTQTNVPETVETTAPTEPPSESESETEAPTTEPTEATTEATEVTTEVPDDGIDDMYEIGAFPSVEEAFANYPQVSVRYADNADVEDGYDVICRDYKAHLEAGTLSGTCAFIFSDLENVGFLVETEDVYSDDYIYPIVTQIYAYGKLYDISEFNYNIAHFSCRNAIVANNEMVCVVLDSLAIVLRDGYGEVLHPYLEPVKKRIELYSENGVIKYRLWRWWLWSSRGDGFESWAEYYLQEGVSGDDVMQWNGTLQIVDGKVTFCEESTVSIEEWVSKGEDNRLNSILLEFGCDTIAEAVEYYRWCMDNGMEDEYWEKRKQYVKEHYGG